MGADNRTPGCFVHGGNVHAWARASGGAITDLLDYSANINPLGLSDKVRLAIMQAVEQVIHYPDAEATMLKAALGQYYQVEPGQITVGNGAVELLYVLAHTLRPKRVLIPAPAFCEYERAARAAGAGIEYFYLPPAENFVVDVSSLGNCLPGMDMVFIGNPNNPTGTLLTVSQLEQVVLAARQTGAVVVVDESFMDFLVDDRGYTCRPLLKNYDNLVILHSLTKFYAIPGLRLGFALTHPDLAAKLHAAKDPWNVNSLAQAAGIAALTDDRYQQKSREVVQEAKQNLYAELTRFAGLKPLPPAVNYILLDTGASGYTAAELRNRLAKKNVLIRDCGNYPGLSPYYMRIAVKLAEQNIILLEHLTQVLR